MMRDTWMNFAFGGMWIGHFTRFLLLGGLIWFVLARSRWSGRVDGLLPSEPTARRILDERFAMGEIDQAEYDARRKALSA